MKTNIVLTMAGNYSRFRLFGNKVPKYLLPLGSGTVLSMIIKQIKKSSKNANIFLIANRNDQIFFPIIRSIMNNYNISNEHLTYVDTTSSQLETALLASEIIPQKDFDLPISFTNIDTVLFDRSKYFLFLDDCKANDGIIDTFVGHSKYYSYIRTEGNNLVSDVEDKNMISSIACSGLYGFGSYSVMSSLAIKLLKKNSTSNFTDLYKAYLKNSNQVSFFHSDNPKNTIVLGTPEEYIINIHKFK
jgi:dTDP-glucose pyrophosphorylase